jgi:LuxR family maltose regulon positive regulatory protein
MTSRSKRESDLPIIEPKKLKSLLDARLHRPLLPEDCVHRHTLLGRLSTGEKRSLSLICAPAGYGKSSLAIDWLANSGLPSCWLSLNQSDDDLRLFLRYMIGALQQQFPGILSTLLTNLSANEVPPLPDLVTAFCNELERSEQRFILALDDYHLVQDLAIHEFLNKLLEHPLRSLHLALITRRNPPLSLARLRANDQISELRMNELRFTEEESAEFLGKSTKTPLDTRTIAQIHSGTEGWAVGLRLAILALHYEVDLSTQLYRFDGNLYEVQQYLMSEVLNAISAQEQEWLCKTAILDQFTAELCEHICGGNNPSPAHTLTGKAFIDKLHDNGLFCIPLDHRRQWHRYHHQFQSLLRERLEANYAPRDIKALHLKAAQWLQENGNIEQALRHYQRGGDQQLARETLLKHRQEAFNREEAYRVQNWLRIVGDIASTDPELLLVRAWIAQRMTRYGEVADTLTQLETALESAGKMPDNKLKRLRGESEALRSVLAYWNTDAKAAVAHAEHALDLLPAADAAARGFVVLIKVGALQMLGRTADATAFAHALMEQREYRQGTVHGRLLQGLCYAYSFTADIPALLRTCVALDKYGEQNQLPESLEYAAYFRGITYYQRNELHDALSVIEPIVSSRNYTNYHIYTSSVCTLAYIHMALGEEQKALLLAESLVETTLNSGASGSTDMAQACLADLALRRGRSNEAIPWADTFEYAEPKATTRVIMPELVCLKTRIHQDTPDAHREVEALLDSLQQFLDKIHNTRFGAELQAIRGLALLQQDKPEEALLAIHKAVQLAQAGGYIRLFVDLGPRLIPLLNQLRLDEIGLEYVGRILSAFSAELARHSGTAIAVPGTGVADAAGEVLSAREQEILQMLAQRLNNKEIGAKLFISPATVKRHAHNIYEKLGVHGRREAVAKGMGLGLLSQ